MFALDTNILVYAHNKDSDFNEAAAAFLENTMNDRDEQGNLQICLLSQVLMEFVNVITRPDLKSPSSLSEAIKVIHDYLDTDIPITIFASSSLASFILENN